MRRVYRPTPSVEVVAHRGASAYRPEHTIAAYDLALQQGADMLELDLRPRADGRLAVVHDPTPEPVAARALTLEDVLERYGTSTRYLVELKDPDPAWEQSVPAALARYGLEEHAVVQSFDAIALRRLRSASPWLSCAPLHRRKRGGRGLDAIARYATGIGVWHRSVDAALVGSAHARGLAVRAWTVNEPRAIERLLALGVDGIITDAPDVAHGIIARTQALPLAA